MDILPILSAPACLLRPLALGDAGALYAIRADADAARFTGVPAYTNLAQAQAYIARVMQGHLTGACYFWAIAPPEGGEMLGGICLWNPAADKSTYDVGYELAVVARGRGLMTGVLQAVARFAFEELGMQALLADPHADNTSSRRLLKRCGFAFVKQVPRQNGPHCLYRLAPPQ